MGKPREVTASPQKSSSVLSLCCSPNSTNFSVSAERREQCQDMRGITMYKNSGDRGDCIKYRGSSLLNVVDKTVRVILSRLQMLSELVYPDAQCGFRRARCTTDMLVSLRQLQKKYREQQVPLHTAFIDLIKAFDLVCKRGLFKLLEKNGCPPKLLSMITAYITVRADLTVGMRCSINYAAINYNGCRVYRTGRPALWMVPQNSATRHVTRLCTEVNHQCCHTRP